MILLDTSAWISFFNRGWPSGLNFDDVATCAPIIQEILQGIIVEPIYKEVKEGLLRLPFLCDPIGHDLYLNASEIYRLGRRKGYTIRSSVDCLISAIAIANDIPILHYDRDYDFIEKFTTLKIKTISI